MDRLWVIEAKFRDGVWGICDFASGSGEGFAFTNFYDAHKAKRNKQKYLQEHGSKTWYKKCFRVVEYVSRGY